MAAVALAVAVIAGCSTPSSPDPEPAPRPTEPPPVVAAAIVDLTNAERTRAGIGALHVNALLMEAARIQADQLAASGRLDHTLPEAPHPRLEDRLDAVGYRWQTASENLAFGQSSAAAVMDARINTCGTSG